MNLKNLLENIYYHCPVVLQNFLISCYGQQLWRKRYGQSLEEILLKIRNIQELSTDELESLKLGRLKSILQYSYTEIDYYKNLFDEIGFSPSKITSFDDLGKIPPLEKETLRLTPDKFVPKNIKKVSYAVHKTSGSTGTPLEVHLDEKTYRLVMALLVDFEAQQGVGFGAKRATFAGRMIQKIENMRPPFWRFNSAENQMLFSSYHLNRETFPDYLNALNKFKPDEIIGYPSAIYSFACFCRDLDCQLDFMPKIIITNSETLLGWQRKTMEDVYGCQVADYYGTSEAVVFAGQCHSMNYHISPLLGEVEVVDSKSEKVFGEVGDILCTTLSNYAMPLIRYRVGDVGKMEHGSCGCSSNLQFLSIIEGRTDDVILTHDGRKIGRIDHIFKGVKGIKECQVVQTDYTVFTLNIVKGNDFNSESADLVVDNLKERIGEDITSTIHFLPMIPRSSRGKFQGVVRCNFETLI